MNSSMLRNSLKYILIPGKPAFGSPAAEIHNLAFEFWMQFWTAVFKKNGVNEKPNPDDFLRQDRISVLMHGKEVIALHAYSYFDRGLGAARSHSYFAQSFTQKSIATLESLGAKRLMSMEYFSVSPQWRSPTLGVSLAAIITCLGFKVFEQSGADALLGISRVDVGVAKMSYDFGAVALDKNVPLHGTPCDLIAILRGQQRPYRDEAENELAAFFWATRTDYTQSLGQTDNSRRVYG